MPRLRSALRLPVSPTLRLRRCPFWLAELGDLVGERTFQCLVGRPDKAETAAQHVAEEARAPGRPAFSTCQISILARTTGFSSRARSASTTTAKR